MKPAGRIGNVISQQELPFETPFRTDSFVQKLSGKTGPNPDSPVSASKRGLMATRVIPRAWGRERHRKALWAFALRVHH